MSCQIFSVLWCYPNSASSIAKKKKKAFLGEPLFSVPIGIFRSLSSLAPSLEYMNSKENPRKSPPYHGFSSEAPGQSAFSSLLCSRRNRKYISSIFVEVVVLHNFAFDVSFCYLDGLMHNFNLMLPEYLYIWIRKFSPYTLTSDVDTEQLISSILFTTFVINITWSRCFFFLSVLI